MEEDNFLQVCSEIKSDSNKRKICERCCRPSTVCLCSSLPKERIQLRRTKLHILQHPNEKNRPLHTVAILEATLSLDSFRIYKGRRFGSQTCPQIHEVSKDSHAYLVYPGENAKSLKDLMTASEEADVNLIVLDGTWRQAASIYAQNEFLQKLCKIQLNPDRVSEYVIRTQPTDSSLSTIECVALALEATERSDVIRQILLKPLRELCKFQLDCGAAIHHSKESIVNGNAGDFIPSR